MIQLISAEGLDLLNKYNPGAHRIQISLVIALQIIDNIMRGTQDEPHMNAINVNTDRVLTATEIASRHFIKYSMEPHD